VKNAWGETFEESLERATNGKLWHGETNEALTKLELLMTNVRNKEKRSKLKGLKDYLN